MKPFPWMRLLEQLTWTILGTIILLVTIIALPIITDGFWGLTSLQKIPAFFAHVIGFHFTPLSPVPFDDSANQNPILSLFFSLIVYFILIYIPFSILIFLLFKMHAKKLHIFITCCLLFLFVVVYFSVAKAVPILSPNQILFPRPQLTIFIKNGTPDAQAQSFVQTIKNTRGVYKVRYNSQLDAFNMYKKQNQDNPQLLELVTPDIFPASLEVFVTFLSTEDTVMQLAKTQTFVEKVVLSNH